MKNSNDDKNKTPPTIYTHQPICRKVMIIDFPES